MVSQNTKQKTHARTLPKHSPKFKHSPIGSIFTFLYSSPRDSIYCLLFSRNHRSPPREVVTAAKRIQLSVPDYLIEALKLNSSLHSRNNRFSKLNFLTPRYRLKTEGGSTFLVTAIEQWNMLGADLKKEITVKSFRRTLHQKLLKNQQFLPHF